MPTFQELGLQAKEYHKNPRKIETEDVEKLSESIEKYGDLSGIVHNVETDEIISGNQRSFKVFDIASCEIEFTQQNEAPDEQGTVALGYLVYEGKKYAYRQVKWSEEWAEEANIAANAAGGTWDEAILSSWNNEDLLTKWGLEVPWREDFEILEEEPNEKEYDEDIETNHQCPKCGYEW